MNIPPMEEGNHPRHGDVDCGDGFMWRNLEVLHPRISVISPRSFLPCISREETVRKLPFRAKRRRPAGVLLKSLTHPIKPLRATEIISQ